MRHLEVDKATQLCNHRKCFCKTSECIFVCVYVQGGLHEREAKTLAQFSSISDIVGAMSIMATTMFCISLSGHIHILRIINDVLA